MCKNVDDWSQWKNREIHRDKHFIEDGAVDIDIWRNQPIKVLFLMKEAYGDIPSLTTWLSKCGHGGAFGNASTFRNVIKWNTAVKESILGKRCNYTEHISSTDIFGIAIVNLKKSSGKKESNSSDLNKYVESDWDLIEQQISNLKPNIVVCCGTFHLIKNKIEYTKNASGCRYNKVKWKKHNEPFIINFVHPASRGMKHSHLYYALASISSE